MTPHIALISSSRTGCPSQRTIPAIPHTAVSPSGLAKARLHLVRLKPDSTDDRGRTLERLSTSLDPAMIISGLRLQAEHQVTQSKVNTGVDSAAHAKRHNRP